MLSSNIVEGKLEGRNKEIGTRILL